MNTPRERDLDRLLDDDGGEFGALYRRLPHAEPPRRLDRAVLGNAARAVRGKTPRRHRWVMAFGSAAGVVLAAGIAWHVGQDALRQQSMHENASGAAAILVPVHPITSSRLRHNDARTKMDDVTAMPIPAEPEPPAKPAAAPQSAPAAHAKQAAARAPSRPPPPPAAPMLAPAPAPAPFATAPPQSSNTTSADATNARGDESVSKPAAHASDSREEIAPARTRIRGGGAPSPASSMELRRDMQLAPEEWLAHIRQLLHQGRRQQAAESLRLFHDVHPQHPLHADLQALLE